MHALRFLLATRPVKRLLQAYVDSRPAGPSDAQRATGSVQLVAEVRNAAGDHARSTLRTAEGYTYTALASLHIAQLAAAGEAPPGFQTPCRAFGSEVALAVEGTERRDE